MQKSAYTYLKTVNTLVLCAGHGGGDPGAVTNNTLESDQNLFIVNEVARLLKTKGIEVVIAPPEMGLESSIAWVNQRYGWGDAWAIEFHRDSATGIDVIEGSKRVGIFGYGTYDTFAEDTDSMDIARFMKDVVIREGASSNSYAKGDDKVRFGRLGWIRDLACVSHLIELGFMQADGSDTNLKELARKATVAIYEAFTGEQYIQTTIPTPDQTSSGFDISALRAQNNPDVWNSTYITLQIKNAVTQTQDIEFLLKQIIASEDAHVNATKQLDVFQTQIKDLRSKLTTTQINYDQQISILQQQLANGQTQDPNLTAKIIELQSLIDKQITLISNLEQKVTTLQTENDNLKVLDPSTKNFFQSKKVWISLLSNLLSFGLVIYQTANIQMTDSWQTIAIKLTSAVLAALGISTVANQYVKTQGLIDASALDAQFRSTTTPGN
ncbi:MAG: N-acetylmuramoyl-L-alanine amidase [Candidatus Roizmanbacteria bacterium]